MGSVRVGLSVADFQLECYDPVADDFGEISLEEMKHAGKWTILFFYTADFSSL
jgi:alkyl hydroperoxide reductase subunit AhpC